MMKPDSKFLDDLARMAGGAAGLVSSMRQQMTDDMKDRAESFISRMDLPTRKELDFLQAQVKALRAEVEALKGGKNDARAKKQTASKAVKPKKAKPKKVLSKKVGGARS